MLNGVAGTAGGAYDEKVDPWLLTLREVKNLISPRIVGGRHSSFCRNDGPPKHSTIFYAIVTRACREICNALSAPFLCEMTKSRPEIDPFPRACGKN